MFNGHVENFYNIDLHKHEVVDIVCDVYELSRKLASGYADCIICSDVLEHLNDPFEACEQMRHVLKDGGVLFMSVPFLYRIHSSDSVSDYFRYTSDGLRFLLRNYSQLKISYSGSERMPYCYFIQAIK